MKSISNSLTFFCLVVALSIYFPQKNYAQDESATIGISNYALDLPDEEIIRHLKQYLQTDSLNIRSWLMLGSVWESKMQYDSAAFAYQKAIQIDSTCSKCKQLLANTFANRGMITKSIGLFEQALAIDSNSIAIRSQYARLLKRDSRFFDAFRQFEILLQNDTLNPYVWEQLGDCALKIDSVAIALQAFNTSFELNPANMPLATKLINGFVKAGIPPFIVMPIAYTAYSQDSTYIPIVKMIGYLQFLSLQYRESEKWLEKAYTAGDSSRFTLKFLGISKYHLGSYLQSSELLEKAFFVDTTDNALNFVLAKAYIEVGDWKKAVDLLDLTEELITPNPIEVAALFATRGEAYTKSRQYQLAVDQYRKALELNPDYKAYSFEIGLSYYYLKNYNKAKDILEDFIDEASEKPDQKSAYERIGSAKHFLRLINKELFFLD